ncbi:hypothetical protein C5167_010431 [Papaver somniferum]|uniref:Uncharacterized protein n=1 Tax=Papaver somniferum TaxID=3469 RepID=A0A4Y7K1L6_PAPSO|nr:uncharacterized protein LOC113288967 [Papaver somniferum]RZC66746.1 hypothetical protein C5167_010431 [Papaver somniferum]
MERLIHSSSSSLSTKTYVKPTSQFLPYRIDRAVSKLGFSSFPQTKLNRIQLHSSTSSSFSPLMSAKSSSVRCSAKDDSSSSTINSGKGSTPRFQFLKEIVVGASKQVKAVPAAAVILLSALILISINPILSPPAYATAIQSEGSVAATVGGKLLLSSAWTGFFAGCLHTLSGPDHLAALAPLSIGRTRMESAAVGALWGFGHDAGQVIFGLLFLLLKDRLHIEILQTWGTRIVGLTLLFIGATGIKEASEVPAPVPCVTLENGECDVSALEPLEAPKAKKKIGLATFATGIVHGLQPDALLMVLPALALPSRLAGAAFLGMFLLGTVFAMGSYTVFIGSCTEALKERVPRITEILTWASSLVAIALGLAILVSQFLGFSLY